MAIIRKIIFLSVSAAMLFKRLATGGCRQCPMLHMAEAVWMRIFGLLLSAYLPPLPMPERWRNGGDLPVPAVTALGFEFRNGRRFYYKLESDGPIMWGLFVYGNI